jgi:hypothetical protein
MEVSFYACCTGASHLTKYTAGFARTQAQNALGSFNGSLITVSVCKVDGVLGKCFGHPTVFLLRAASSVSRRFFNLLLRFLPRDCELAILPGICMKTVCMYTELPRIVACMQALL